MLKTKIKIEKNFRRRGGSLLVRRCNFNVLYTHIFVNSMLENIVFPILFQPEKKTLLKCIFKKCDLFVLLPILVKVILISTLKGNGHYKIEIGEKKIKI